MQNSADNADCNFCDSLTLDHLLDIFICIGLTKAILNADESPSCGESLSNEK